MSSHFVRVEIVGMSDLLPCDLFEILQSQHIGHHERPSRKDTDVRPVTSSQPRGYIGEIGHL